MPERIPLSTLLSQALVAFTIEFDNEAEHQLPHRTTVGGSPPGSNRELWLVSMAMWLNCMRFVGEHWITVGELVRRARTETNLPGMRRWRYIDLEPAPNETRPKPPTADLLVRSTRSGLAAQAIWRPLGGAIEERWTQRFGPAQVESLRTALVSLVSRLDEGLPDCMPILGYGLLTKVAAREEAHPAGARAAELALPTLLARPLVAFASEFEREARASLAIHANVLRVLDEVGIGLPAVARRAGVSREALSMATGVLEKARLVVSEADPTVSRGKRLRLTRTGRSARDAQDEVVGRLETRWEERFGAATLSNVRATLEPLVGDAGGDRSPLFGGLDPHPDGWRASLRKPETLPHFPMVLHRGGYPDGS